MNGEKLQALLDSGDYATIKEWLLGRWNPFGPRYCRPMVVETRAGQMLKCLLSPGEQARHFNFVCLQASNGGGQTAFAAIIGGKLVVPRGRAGDFIGKGGRVIKEIQTAIGKRLEVVEYDVFGDGAKARWAELGGPEEYEP